MQSPFPHLQEPTDLLLWRLTHLFGFYSSCVLSTKAQLSDSYIVQNEAEVLGALRELSSDQQGHLRQG